MTDVSIDYVLDIEVQDWDTFVVGAIDDIGGSIKTYQWRQEDKFIDHILSLEGQIWTWNGGLFDTLWAVQHFRKRGLNVRCYRAGTKIIKAECENVSIRDGSAIYPTSLAKLAKAAGIILVKDTGLPCLMLPRCGKNGCGGYCRIRRNMKPSEMDKVIEYLHRDIDATRKGMETIIQEARRCEYILKGTVGSTSYATAKRICGLSDAEWEWPHYRFARRSYYGGRVAVFKPMAERGFAYDKNSAYPAALTTTDLPIGAPILCKGERAQKAYRREWPGIYMARVRVPRDMHVPPLPCRTPGGRIVFPVGDVRGVWTILELRAAEESGCAVQVGRAMVWREAERVMLPFMRHAWACRQRALDEGNKELSGWHKWVPNSCTGKFAESPQKEKVVINPELSEIKRCECGSKTKRQCRCKPWRPLDQDGEIWAAPFWRIPSNGHVHWAAYLTAATRISLRDQLVSDGCGGLTALYCDTDSVYATTERYLDIGLELGQWKLENIISKWEALAPKVYRFMNSDGEWVVKGKGLPGLTSEQFDAFRAGEKVVNERGVKGFGQAARGDSLFTRKRLERRNHADGIHFGDRILGKDGLTHPMTYWDSISWEKEHGKSKSRKK
jgi:hypothetical protein